MKKSFENYSITAARDLAIKKQHHRVNLHKIYTKKVGTSPATSPNETLLATSRVSRYEKLRIDEIRKENKVLKRKLTNVSINRSQYISGHKADFDSLISSGRNKEIDRINYDNM
jgi:hypothetical protein